VLVISNLSVGVLSFCIFFLHSINRIRNLKNLRSIVSYIFKLSCHLFIYSLSNIPLFQWSVCSSITSIFPSEFSFELFLTPLNIVSVGRLLTRCGFPLLGLLSCGLMVQQSFTFTIQNILEFLTFSYSIGGDKII